MRRVKIIVEFEVDDDATEAQLLSLCTDALVQIEEPAMPEHLPPLTTSGVNVDLECDPEFRPTAPKPLLELDRYNTAFISITYFDAYGTATRTSVLSGSYGVVADSVMRRKFNQLRDLLGNKVRAEITPAFLRGERPS